MDTKEATQLKTKHVRTARALCTVATVLGKRAKVLVKQDPQSPEVRRMAGLLTTLATQMAKEIELARLYESFALEYKA